MYIHCQEQRVYASCSVITYGIFIERFSHRIVLKESFSFPSHILLICFSCFSQGLTLESVYSDWLDTPEIPKVRKKNSRKTYFAVLLFFYKIKCALIDCILLS